MIASTFWKNTIPLCTGCDQSTARSSSWCSVKLPAVWKNFFGTIGARSLTSASASRSPSRARRPDTAALEELPGRPAVQLDDHVAVDVPDPSLVEGHQLHRRLLPGPFEPVHERDHRVVPRRRYAASRPCAATPPLRTSTSVRRRASTSCSISACGGRRPRSPPPPSAGSWRSSTPSAAQTACASATSPSTSTRSAGSEHTRPDRQPGQRGERPGRGVEDHLVHCGPRASARAWQGRPAAVSSSAVRDLVGRRGLGLERPEPGVPRRVVAHHARAR